MFRYRSAIETIWLAGALKLINLEKKFWSAKDFISRPSDPSHVAIVLSIPYGPFTIFLLIPAIPCSVATDLKGPSCHSQNFEGQKSALSCQHSTNLASVTALRCQCSVILVLNCLFFLLLVVYLLPDTTAEIQNSHNLHRLKSVSDWYGTGT